MLQKKYELDLLGNQTTLRILRCLYSNLYRSLSMSEIASLLDTSRSNIHRRLPELEQVGIVRTKEVGKRKRYIIDSSSNYSKSIFKLFNEERLHSLDPKFINKIACIKKEMNPNSSECLILFGSYVKNTQQETSDIDLCQIGNKNIKKNLTNWFPGTRIDLHKYTPAQFQENSDLVAVDAKLFGIAILGEDQLFHYRTNINSIPKQYLISRLISAEKNISRSKKVENEARDYFIKIAQISIGEVESILNSGVTIPKNDIRPISDIERKVDEIHHRLSKLGDAIWLT